MTDLSSTGHGQKTVVTLAFVDPFPPFAQHKGGRAEGLGIELLDAALSRAGLRAVFVPAGLDEVQELLRRQDAEGLAFVAITAERRRLYDYSDSVIRTGGALFAMAPNQLGFDLADYSGRTICTPEKGPLAAYIRSEFPEISLQLVADYAAAMEAVLQGKARAAALNFHVGSRLARERFPGAFTTPGRIFLEMDLAVAVLKGKGTSLLARLNAGLKMIRESGLRGRILEKWHFQAGFAP